MPKLGRDNQVFWKQQLSATARDRGLYANITGMDTLPTAQTQLAAIAARVTVTLAQLVDKWTDRNNTAYNQILLCISSELQTAINGTDVAATAWSILVRKFESHNPIKISIV